MKAPHDVTDEEIDQLIAHLREDRAKFIMADGPKSRERRPRVQKEGDES